MEPLIKRFVKTIDKRVKDPPFPKNKCHKIFKKCQTFEKKKLRKRIFRAGSCAIEITQLRQRKCFGTK